MHPPTRPNAALRPLPNLIFASRWLQLPLYLGLIGAQAVYVFHFWVELVPFVGGSIWQPDRLAGPGYQHWLQDRRTTDQFERNRHHAGGAGLD